MNNNTQNGYNKRLYQNNMNGTGGGGYKDEHQYSQYPNQQRHGVGQYG
jgi:hypothetical protein